MAQPTPPPTTATFLKPSYSVATPRGPTKSRMESPTSLAASSFVDRPTFWKMMVTVPFSVIISDGQRDTFAEFIYAENNKLPRFGFLPQRG